MPAENLAITLNAAAAALHLHVRVSYVTVLTARQIAAAHGQLTVYTMAWHGASMRQAGRQSRHQACIWLPASLVLLLPEPALQH